ncbi:MAG: T9SS type A sorting domain-containing protein [Chitinophagales bacterium]
MLKWIASSILLTTTQLFLNAQYCIENRFTELDLFTSDDIVIQNNIMYGLADDWYGGYMQPQLNSFNIAYPDPAIDTLEKRPLVLLAHGGGFWGGEKENLDDIILSLAQKGFVAVTLNYRKGWDSFGDPIYCLGDGESLAEAIYKSMQDIQACFRFVVANAASYGIDTAWIFAGGESAGVFALFNSIFISQEEWNLLYPTHELMYGSLYDAVNEIETNFSVKGFINMWGGILDTAHMQVAQLKPLISFYGTDDKIVPPYSGHFQDCENYTFIYGSASLNDYYDHYNVCNVLHAREGFGHEIYDHDYVVGNSACFMRSLLCDECENYEVEYMEADCQTAQETEIQNNLIDGLAVYPNPANNFVMINCPGSENEIILYNFSGAIMDVQFAKNNDAFILNTSELPDGIYFFSIRGKIVQTGRFIIVN